MHPMYNAGGRYYVLVFRLICRFLFIDIYVLKVNDLNDIALLKLEVI